MKQDYEKLVDEVEDLLNSAKYDEVVEKLASICQERVPWKVNRLYVKALYEKSQYALAYNEALPYENEYLNQDLDFWLALLLANQLFIPARLAISQNPSGDGHLLVEVEQAEKNATVRQSATIQKIFKNFYHLGDQPEWKQQDIINEADHLPLDKYLQATKFILRDPFVGLIVRNMLLRTLVALNYDQSVTYIGVDKEERDVVPRWIQDRQYQEIVQKVKQEINQKFSHNPVDAQNYLQQFHLQELCLYPLLKTAITDPKSWVRVLIGDIKKCDSPEIKNAIIWQRLIQESLVNRQ